MTHHTHDGPAEELVVLFLAASPSTTSKLAIERELHNIQNQLYNFASTRLKFIPATAVKPLEVHRWILSYRPHVLHFSGHGNKQEGILMLNEVGEEQPVPPHALADVLDALSEGIYCVILNACYTSDQAQALAQSIPYVVGIPGAIADEAAIGFSVGFYDALAASLPVEKAYQLGTATMNMAFPRSRTSGNYGKGRGQAYRDSERNLKPLTGVTSATPVLITSDADSLGPRDTRLSKPEVNERKSADDLRRVFEEASQASLARLHERLPAPEAPRNRPLVQRPETAPDVERFLSTEEPIMAIVGDSGSGKSTLLYQLATRSSGSHFNAIPLLYDSHQIKAEGSLLNRLALDFQIPSSHLFDFLRDATAILNDAGSKLLVLVDGINEVDLETAEGTKIVLEDLAVRLGTQIKIIYTCRSVFWEAFMQPEGRPPSRLYFHGIHKLGGFSESEAREAVDAYRQYFGFSGSFDEMAAELQERVRDPLMLRMLAEAYAKRPLPDYAPAVAIFAKYEERLRRKFRAEPVLACLQRMIALKASSFLQGEPEADYFKLQTILSDPVYARLASQSRSSTPPHLALQDEGILVAFTADEEMLRFSYERFYEFLLGRALVQDWERSRSPEDSAANLVERALKAHYSYGQALKSELLRRDILGLRDGVFHSLLAPPNLSLLLKGACNAFAQEVLRELMFDSSTNVPHLIASALGDTSDTDLLIVGIAPEAPETVGALVSCLFSGDRRLMLRASQLLPRFLRRDDVRDQLKHEVLTHFNSSSEIAGEALVLFMAHLFAWAENTGQAPGPQLSSILCPLYSSLDVERSQLTDLLTTSFTALVRKEGTKFYGEGFTQSGLEYPWKAMGAPERDCALRLNAAITDCSLFDKEEFRKLALFFGSGVRRWRRFLEGFLLREHDYQIEYRIVQWSLLRYSDYDFEAFLSILDSFAAYGSPFCLDSAQSMMEFCLQEIHHQNHNRLTKGFELMVSWDTQYRRLPDYYAVLEAADPFAVNNVPLVMVARVEALFFTPDGMPIQGLRERLLAGGKDALVALLTARWLWHEFPRRTLATLEVALDHWDARVCNWLDLLLTEIYLVHPRLVENFFWRNQVDPQRAKRIKHGHGLIESTNVMYDGAPLYRFLFASDRVGQVATWHRRIYAASNLDEYCSELVEFLVFELMVGSSKKEIN